MARGPADGSERGAWWMTPPAREGWHAARPERLPGPTPWPAATALGTVLLFWGLVTSYLVAAVGLGLLALSGWGWIKDLWLERTRHE